MTTHQLLTTLYDRGIIISVDEADLVIDCEHDALSDEDIILIKQHKTELVALINALERADKVSNGVVKHNTVPPYQSEPSLAQSRMLFMESLAGDQSYYNLPIAYQVKGVIDKSALTQAYGYLLNKHDILRTTYPLQGGEYIQQVDDYAAVNQLEIIEQDLSSATNINIALEQALNHAANHRFNLTAQWPIEFRLIKLAVDDFVIAINIHHIAADGWSARTIVSQISHAYRHFKHSDVMPDEVAGYQYADHVIQFNHWLNSADHQDAMDYWVERLTSMPLLHNLPTDFSRPKIRTAGGAHYVHQLSNPVFTQITKYSSEQSVSPVVVLQSAFTAFLARYSGQSDIVFGLAAANRELVEFVDTVGLFVNTLVMRSKLDPKQSFTDLIAATNTANNQAKRFQQLPFDSLVEVLDPQRGLGYNPLVQIMLVVQDDHVGRLTLDSLTMTPIMQPQKVSKFDLTLEINLSNSGIHFCWEYSTDLFEHNTVVLMGEHFSQLLAGLVEHPDQDILSLPMLSTNEQNALQRWNKTTTEYPKERCIHQLFEQQVVQHPNAIAVVFAAKQLSYRELNARANQVARYLIEHDHVTAGMLVGICVSRTENMLIGILAILKAGAAYVPLDPNYPQARLDRMIEDAALTTVLSDRCKAFSLGAVMQRYGDDNLDLPGLSSNNLAYVIFTSGSTGKPKGVMIEHRNATAMLSWALQTYSQRELSGVCAATSMCFDLSVFEFFAPLSAGGTIYLVQDLLALPSQHFVNQITLINTVPSAADVVLSSNSKWASLISVNLAGEPLSQSIVERLYQMGIQRVYDLYGPSEDTTYSTFALRQKNGHATIGKPIDNTRAYVLNLARQPVPIGVVGELYLAGDGVSRGYLNRPDLTAEKFIDHTFSRLPLAVVEDKAAGTQSERLYQTGDLVRYNQAGELQYIGRIDQQVKVRGFRIELGEIAYHLNGHALVKQGLVLVKSDHLVAYIVATDAALSSHQQKSLFDALRQALRAQLAEYMVPSHFILLEKLPLLSNGKVDNKTLLQFDVTTPQENYVAPTKVIEEKLCALWQRLLNVDVVGITDNFFALGGHSLLATTMSNQLANELNITVPLALLFSHQTIESYAPQLTALSHQMPRPKIGRAPRECALVTSFAQQRLWLLEQIDGTSTQYNMPAALTLTGELDIAMLNKAFTTIVERHESLRTVFAKDQNGEPVQIIVQPSTVDMMVTPLTRSELSLAIQRHGDHPFDLASDLMLQLALVKITTLEHVLLFNMHHIAADGWSIGILINELNTLYNAYIQGDKHALPALSTQYADYAYWQRNWLSGQELSQTLDYWQAQLKGLPNLHSLPLDKTRPPIQTYHGAVLEQTIAKSTTTALKTKCQDSGVTLFMGLHSVFSVLLARFSNETDIVVGSPVANREQVEVADLIGFFVNTLVLRCDLSNNPNFDQLLAQSKQTLLGAYSHQQLPFEKLVEQLQPERSLSHSPLFQVMLALQNNAETTFSMSGLTVNMLDCKASIAKYDLTLTIKESCQALTLSWNYNTDLFLQSTIKRLSQQFERLIQALMRQPHMGVLDVDIIDAQERQLLLNHWSTSPGKLPEADYLHSSFEHQVKQTPGSIALVFEQQHLTYNELNQRANRLAHCLVQQHGVKPDSLVAICIDRSLNMVIGILAILKAGGAYVPIDPTYPVPRLRHMLEDSGVKVILTQQSLLQHLPLAQQTSICLDNNTFNTFECTNLAVATLGLKPDHLAYVIYTSGSTGMPKGVMVAHRPIAKHTLYMCEMLSLTAEDRLLQFASMSFDPFVHQTFAPLSVGARLYLREGNYTPEQFYQYCDRHKINVTGLPTLFLNDLLLSNNMAQQFWQQSTLDRVIVGGEAVPYSLVQQWQKLTPNNSRLFNGYGPTEAVIIATVAPIDQQTRRVTIGKPIAGRQVYVLDKRLQPVSIGQPGQLYIGGQCLARGYLNQAQLTQKHFIHNPFNASGDANVQSRLYKTGDLVRWLSSGELEFLGRTDDQVKIRGFRIELGEIERQLVNLPQVKDAHVVVYDQQDNKRLVAYVVMQSSENECAVSQLRGQLSEQLPEYMIPWLFMLVDALPVKPNGKVDQHALPAVQLAQQQSEYVPARNPTEEILCTLWQQLLGIEQVGISDNFFELGGHSLLATRMVTQLGQQLNILVPLKLIFTYQTIDALAAQVGQLMQQDQYPVLKPVSREQTLPVSFTQQRLWLLSQIDGTSAHYNMPVALHLSGDLNVSALNKTFTTLVTRHESLRTVFTTNAMGEPVQIINQPATINLEIIALTKQAVDEAVQAHASFVFDLSSDLMLQLKLLKLGDFEHILLFNIHHISSDGWSIGILIAELNSLYSAFVSAKDNPLHILPIQYADYAQWQRNWLTGDVLQVQVDYWQQQLADLPMVHQLPLKSARPLRQSFKGELLESHIEQQTIEALQLLCHSVGATLFMGFHAVFSVLLARYSNETDIVVGCPVANREQAEVAGLVGFFANTLVLRSDLSGTPSFKALLLQSKQTLLDAYTHQQLPFETLVEHLQPERNLSHSPLFQVMLEFQNNETQTIQLPGLTLTQLTQQVVVAKYDLTLRVKQDKQDLQIYWEYNTDLFESATIKQMSQHFNTLLKSLVEQPEQGVMQAFMLEQAEQNAQLTQCNDNATDHPQDVCIHWLFEQQVIKTPDAIALQFAAEKITFYQLNQRANQLAHYLIDVHHVGPDKLVGLCAQRSLDMVIAMVAILKAGGAYVPLDPQYPQARLDHIINNAGLTVTLAQQRFSSLISTASCFDDPALLSQLNTFSTANVRVAAMTSRHLAYVIYTSGSTGQPKGVMVEHQALVNRINWMERQYPSRDDDRFLQKTPFTFDVSVWEFMWPLISGARMILAKPEGHKDPKYLSQLIAQQRITKCHFVPSMLSTMLSYGDLAQCQSLRQVFCSGEALLQQQVDTFKQHFPTTQLHNLYGPTEAAIEVSYWDCLQQGHDCVPIGKAIDNIQLLVLDNHLNICARGVAGELHIGGVGLARGYLNSQALTAQKFIPSPFSAISGCSDRLYKTGDRVRLLADGNLQYLGRIDNQVKIRGLRIELGEIEHVLLDHYSVQSAVVRVRTGIHGDPQLVAWIVSEAADGDNASVCDSLDDYASKHLPDYMIPVVYVPLERLPLTSSGKVDNKALPAPDITTQQMRYVEPNNDIEKILCELWQQVLGIEKVGIRDNFFNLGGHSLLATKMISQLARELTITVPLALLFNHQTIESFAPQLAALAPEIDRAQLCQTAREGPLETSFAQQRLWLLDQIDNGSSQYNMPIALKLCGELNVEALNNAFSAIVMRHESLRTVFAKGSNDQPVQVINAAQPINISLQKLSGSEPDKANISRLIQLHSQYTFDLTADLMLQLGLIRVTEQEHILLFNMHHIASDGWSMGILINELNLFYAAFLQGNDNPLPPLEIQYADYAHWQRRWLAGDELARQLDYWQQQLAALPAVHSLPLDKSRASIQRYNGSTITHKITPLLSKQLNHTCQAAGVTLFMGLHSAFSVLLARYSNETDIVMGSPVANREQVEVAQLIGFFVNTLVLRSDLSDNPSFEQLLAQSKQTLLAAYAHQQVPFEQVVEQLQPERSRSHSPLFQIMLVLQNNEEVSFQLPGLTVSPIERKATIAKYDLTLTVIEHQLGLSLHWQYNEDLFNQQTIEQMSVHFSVLLNAMLASPQSGVLSLPFLTDNEQQQQLQCYNDTKVHFPQNLCVHEQFERQVALLDQNAVALTFDGQQMTYHQLNKRANQLAHRLIAQHKVTPGSFIGLCLHRGFDLIIAMIGIMKAGAAYVPIDPALPPSRIDYMITDSQLNIVISERELMHFDQTINETKISWLTVAGSIDYSIENIPKSTLALTSQHPVYVIYTSGSTGQPKGVIGVHRSLVNRLNWMQDYCPIDDDEVFCQKTSISFGDHASEIFQPLISGRKLVIFSVEQVQSSNTLMAEINHHKITRITLVPSLLRAMIDQATSVNISSLRYVFCSGETLSARDVNNVNRYFRQIRLFNIYGSTEMGADATAYEVDFDVKASAPIPIGKPLSNTHTLILDEHMQLVPRGVIGQIYIGGVGLASGYMHKPGLTEQAFIRHSVEHDGQCADRLYRSGDYGRYLADGNIEFVGRVDHQVKIRGFRIELGEVKAALSQSTYLEDVVVTKHDNTLVAYVVVNETLDVTQISMRLREHAKHHLPDYMIPSAFIILPKLPLLPSGKVDVNVLPDPSHYRVTDEYVAPINSIEQELVTIWQQVLRRERVGTRDNFFSLGGHSLLLISLLDQINNKFDVSLKARDLFELQTIETCAALLAGSASNVSFDELVLLKPGRDDIDPLYLVHPIGGQVACYLRLANALTYQGAVYGMQKLELGLASVQVMASHYIDLIQRHHSTGPLNIVGWSLGGVIAFEMAQQLKHNKVNLVMIDSFNPLVVTRTTKTDSLSIEVTLLAMMLDELGINYKTLPAQTLDKPIAELLILALQLGQSQRVLSTDCTIEILSHRLAILIENNRALTAYNARPYNGKVALIRASIGADLKDNGWQAVIPQLSVVTVAGDHNTIVLGEGVTLVANLVDKVIT